MDEVKIYKITNQITKKVYIGQTTKENLEERLSQHSSSSDCPKLHNAIKLYGKESFKIELLDTCSKEQANYIESFFINKYHSIENGYNSIYSSGEFQSEQPRKRIGYGYIWSYLNPQHLKILYNILNDYLTNE